VWTALIAASVEAGSAQSGTLRFRRDAVNKPPAGFTSYATGGGPAGSAGQGNLRSPSGKHVGADRCGSTDTRFPVLDRRIKGLRRSGRSASKGKASPGRLTRKSDWFSVFEIQELLSRTGKPPWKTIPLYRMVDGTRLAICRGEREGSIRHMANAAGSREGHHITCYFNGKA